MTARARVCRGPYIDIHRRCDDCFRPPGLPGSPLCGACTEPAVPPPGSASRGRRVILAATSAGGAMSLIAIDWRAALFLTLGLVSALASAGWVLSDDERCRRLTSLIEATRG